MSRKYPIQVFYTLHEAVKAEITAMEDHPGGSNRPKTYRVTLSALGSKEWYVVAPNPDAAFLVVGKYLMEYKHIVIKELPMTKLQKLKASIDREVESRDNTDSQ
jgi:hypothetical protein